MAQSGLYGGEARLMPLPRWTQPLIHPGPPAEARRRSIATPTIQAHVTLPAGARLVDAMAAEIERRGCTSGQVELLGGTFSKISYCFPAQSLDGTVAVTYSGTHEALVPARLVAGSATVGFRHGERFAHCHVVWFDALGVLRGGHLWPNTVIGPEPVRAVIHALTEVDMLNDSDSESGLPVFTPHCREASTSTSAGVGAVMSRLAPGVEVGSAVRDVMLENGISRASIAGTVGSLCGPVLARDDSVLVVDGPATEVTLTGTFDLDDKDQSHIHAMAVDRFGNVHVGILVEGENIVAVTMELIVQEASQPAPQRKGTA
jgi:predicted DNA-binding protein with PD1-like motif